MSHLPVKTLPVNEMFYTWQGEGIHMGRAAFFVRLHGCPIHCPWCDSAGTWHPNYIPKNVTRMSPFDIAAEIRKTQAQFVVVTGGEPTIHDMSTLTSILSTSQDDSSENRIIPCHLETSGAFQIKGDFAFITVSPKREKLPLKENLLNASEIKIIVDSVESLEEWHRYLERHYFPNFVTGAWASIWLHPEWSQRENPVVLNAISEFVKLHPTAYRAGFQMHKFYRVDSLDKRTQPLAPLGGDLTKGY